MNKKEGLFSKLKKGLSNTKDGLSKNIGNIFNVNGEIDDDFYDQIEEALIMADVGMDTSMNIIDKLRVNIKANKIKTTDKAKDELKGIMVQMLGENEINYEYPLVILFVGVNGVGKTTAIGKLSNKFKNEGKKVIMAAGDTFRAAAAEQLTEWADRSNAGIVKHKEGADPGAVVYDAIQSFRAKKADVLLCDTAGRLHNKKNLMDELKKINKIINRELPEANKEVYIVLDATTGQNAITQAKNFKDVTELNGIVLTKLDGTAKGGVVIAINKELDLPIRYIGIGEGIDDLEVFDPEMFVEALFE